jgi:hypothetical protein
MDELYKYETYCPVDFIRGRKSFYSLEQRDKELYTQDKLNLINLRRNNLSSGKKIVLFYFLICR